jgi:hypothetical protein
VAARLGLQTPVAKALDSFWPFLERMRADGAVVVLKLDGERGPNDNGPYTAMVSGPPLRGEHFRTDAHTPEDALAYVIVSYFDHPTLMPGSSME